jgi:glycyl-tRNA synthetase beta chain
MDRELLLEIGVEELPAPWLPGLTAQLADTLKGRLTSLGFPLKTGVEAHGTPRRLAACVSDLTDRQEDREELMTGPPVSASFDAEGHPTPAALGFARKLNVDFDALSQTDTPKGRYLTYLKKWRGRATVDVLPEVLGQVLRDLVFPKPMHWDAQLLDGKGELLFGRPIRWLLFLYGGRVVPFTISRLGTASSPRVQDVTSGAVTYGHRFLATTGRAGRAIKVRSFDEYRKRLTENFVVLSRIERRDRIVRDLESQGRRLGGRAVLHQHVLAETLMEEVPDLVEFPAVVAGMFSSEFLALPEEVLVTTLIHHQHFFPVATPAGALMPAFLAVTNTQPGNDRTIATNAERVVAARLRDARFFWNADRALGLEARLARLETLMFHKALGSYRQKAERLESLARWIAADVLGQPDRGDAAARAGRLAKADLATDMVREFTELQGRMGGIYSREAGEPEAVWKAIYQHYLPVAVEPTGAPSSDALGDARVTWAAVALADKLDTLVGLFAAGERPTGSRDPFALRRQAHGVLRILLDVDALTGTDARPSLGECLTHAEEQFASVVIPGDVRDAGRGALHEFLRERLEYVLEQRGASVQAVRAVVRGRAVTDLRPLDVRRNITALQELVDSESFRKLAEAFKRVRNIARELTDAEPMDEASLRGALKEPAELALLDEIARRRVAIDRAVQTGQEFSAAYAEAAQFQVAVDRFFTEVFVMVEDPALRAARLHLMKQLEQLILQLGDISEIVAPES